jgi:hypothetical protein
VERERELLAEYGQWRKNQDTASAEDRLQRLADIVTGLLSRSAAPDSLHLHDDDGARAVTYEFDGREYLLVLVLARQDRPFKGKRIIMRAYGVGVAWLYGPGELTDEDLVGQPDTLGALLDRTHLDAAVAGLRPLAELVRGALRRRLPYVSLADLQVTGEPAPMEPGMTPPARLTSTLAVETQTWAGAVAEVALVGQEQQDRPTGLASLPPDRMLITCPDGLLEVDTARGHAHWNLRLPGCHGAALVRRDGAVLVMCGSALVRWHEGALRVIAGGFEEGSVLLAGPDGEPWVLSGSGVTFGAGEGSLALTRAGESAGDQMRYPITFEAAVRSALWLDGRRFFLAASGHSAVVDLTRTTDAGQREEWIRTPVHFPANVLRAGADSVLMASSDGTGGGVGLHRTNVTTRNSDPVVKIRLGEIFGLAQASDSEPAYLLGSMPSNDPAHIRPVLVRITMHRPSAPRPGAIPAARSYDVVSQSARGERDDYALEPRPLAPPGGQGTVFPATHKASGTAVAFKRRSGWREQGARRMRREVEIAQRLGGNPHVMPVLDYDPAYSWFVMPKADATVEERRADLQEPDQLRALVEAVAAGLADAHQHDWIHRDIKPANILLLEGRWVVADWGIVRRPRGQTSTAGLLTNASIGTTGFAAPELSIDGHDVSAASDIYSLGQLIGWIFNGTAPRTNVPLPPPPGPWYGVVRQATQLDPASRPQDIAAFLDLVDRETSVGSELPIARAQRLLEEANERQDTAAASQLLTLAADRPGDYELYLHAIAKLSVKMAEDALLANPGLTVSVVQALTRHAAASDWPTWQEADRAVWWLLYVARLAAREEQWPLLDTAVQGMCDWDGRFDRWKPQDDIKDWMRTLTGHAASIVASVLRAQPDGARHLHELADDHRVDQAIRSAVYRP